MKLQRDAGRNPVIRKAEMRIAYVTTDEVNLALAARMARPLDAAVIRLNPEDVGPHGRFDAVVYDLDHVPPDERPALLDEILSGPPTCPRAVHGYVLSDEEAAALRLRGVAVTQRLQLDLFRTVRRAVLQNLATVTPDDALTDLTWINLTG